MCSVEIISAVMALRITRKSPVRKKPDPRVNPQRRTDDNEGQRGPAAAARGTNGKKKFPMEPWNYGYGGDIGGSFGANRRTALRAAVVTAAKTLKLDDIARSETAYIARTHARTHTSPSDVSDVLLFQRSDRGEPMIADPR